MFALLAATAAKPTVWEKVRAVPGQTWMAIIVAIILVVACVRIWRSLREINEIVPWVVFITFGGSLILYWTYERNEPKLFSPVFDELANILPTRGVPKKIDPDFR